MRMINPTPTRGLKQTTHAHPELCFSCGTCSAICPLNDAGFPRRYVRYVQIGAYDRIMANYRELWRCLHCGLCTATCPRGANPGEVILELKNLVVNTLRRKDHV